MANLRVLHVLDGLNIGGMEIFVMNYYRKINKEVVQFDFAIFENERNHFENEINEFGGRVYKLGKHTAKNKYVYTLNNILSLISFLKHNKYDIIHCHSCSFLGILQGSVAGKIMRTPVIIGHAHSASVEGKSLLDKITRNVFKIMITKTCNHYFACSKNAAETKYLPSVLQNESVVYLNNAVDVDKFKYNTVTRTKLRSKLCIPDNAFVIGTVGRLEKEKNQEFLINVFEKIQNIDKNTYLLIVGSGSLEKYLSNLVNKKEINNVIFTGSVNNTYDYYQTMDLFVLPSLYEGFPFVLVEAQVNGLNCVVSSGVSRTTNVSGGVKFFPLDMELDLWAQELYKYKNCRLNEEQIQRVLLKYDLSNESNKLLQLYLKLYKKGDE